MSALKMNNNIIKQSKIHVTTVNEVKNVAPYGDK